MEEDGAPPGVEAAGAYAEQPLGLEFGGLLGVGEGESGLVGAAGEEVLGEGWAVVRMVGLVPDDHQAAVEPLGPELPGGVQPGEGGTDDGHGPHEARSLAHSVRAFMRRCPPPRPGGRG